MPILFFLFLLQWLFLNPSDVLAQTPSCSVSVYPSNVTPGGSARLYFTITNSGEAGEFSWVRLYSPDLSAYKIENPDTTPWNLSYDNSSATFSNGSITAGNSSTFELTLVENGGSISSMPWRAEASVDGGGTITDCGETSVSVGVEATPIPVSPPVISNVSLSVSSTTATVTWNTDVASTSTVDYGTTASYGLSKTGSSNTSHSATMDGLTASTSYHYRILSTGDGGITSSSDLTFTTTANSTIILTTTVTTTTTVTNTVTSTNTVTKTLTDTTPPSIRYKTIFKKIYEEAPLVEIVSSDGTGIARVEYSTDGGINFSPIDIGDNVGGKQIASEFTPNISEDGDYLLIVKVTDTAGNKQQTKIVNFTIDRLPPRVGPITYMLGPIILNKADLLVGVNYKLILTAAGGPNRISLSCGKENFEFTKNIDSGVWMTNVKFTESGSCAPEITAVDGAGNKQVINNEELIINNLGQAKNSTITVYWYDDYEKKFVKWDASPYGQINPIETYQTGGYGIVLPSGKYYLEAKSAGKRTAVSNIITAQDTIYINDDWELSPAWKFWQLREEKLISPKLLGSSDWTDVNFLLPKVKLMNISTLDIRGKTTVVSLLSSWHPATNNYLKVVDEITKSKINVYPILMQEKNGQAVTLKRRGGYETEIFADQDGEILESVRLNGVPTTWIVNRFGQVVKTKVGEIDKEEVNGILNSID